MNAAQRRLLFWSLVVAALAAHLSCWSWTVAPAGAMSHPVIPLSSFPDLPANLVFKTSGDVNADLGTYWEWEEKTRPERKEWERKVAARRFFGFDRGGSPYDPSLVGLALPAALLIAAAFLFLGRQRPISSPRP